MIFTLIDRACKGIMQICVSGGAIKLGIFEPRTYVAEAMKVRMDAKKREWGITRIVDTALNGGILVPL